MYKIYTHEVDSFEYTFLKDNLYRIILRTNFRKSQNIFECEEYKIYEEIPEDTESIDKYIQDRYQDMLEKGRLQDAYDKKESQISSLKTNLANSDYSVIKTLENFIINNTFSTDFTKLVSERTEMRDRINILDGSIEATAENQLELEKDRKINEMNSISKYTIVNGIEFNDEHYRLNEYDQINLMMLSMLAQQGQSVPYHADGKLCRIYSAEEMTNLAAMAIKWITYHTTYVNLIKHQIYEMTDIAEIKNCYYGMPLNPQYQAVIDAITGSSTESEEEGDDNNEKE